MEITMRTWVTFVGVMMMSLVIGCASSQKSGEKSAENSKTTQSKMKKTSKKMKSSSSKMTADMTVDCSSGSDARKIEVAKSDSGGCQVLYTKFGNSSEIASAQSDPTYCEEVKDRVVSNLEGSGFKCKASK